MSDIFEKATPLLRKHFNTPEVLAILHTNLDIIEEHEKIGTDPEEVISMLKHLMTKTLKAIESEEDEH